jgi:hypothetical protein
MSVLRENRDSVMSMLEAFVYDPLISWRLLATGDAGNEAGAAHIASGTQNTHNDEGDGGAASKNSEVDNVSSALAASSSLGEVVGQSLGNNRHQSMRTQTLLEKKQTGEDGEESLNTRYVHRNKAGDSAQLMRSTILLYVWLVGT